MDEEEWYDECPLCGEDIEECGCFDYD